MNAFPIVLPKDFEGHEDGMTLRDYFAAQAINGFITRSPIRRLADEYGSLEQLARKTYEIADAMIEARGD
jgi:hypothetical protein